MNLVANYRNKLRRFFVILYTMTITEIYEKYEIPPNLADHQLTVAGVAKVICDEVNKGNEKALLTACLLHDMGNIIKFDLDKIPIAKIGRIDHWKVVQQRFIEKYGSDEHQANLTIADDIGVDKEVRDLIDVVGFRHSCDALDSGDISKMIAGYSDMRVAPNGVVPLETRLADLATRYGVTGDREQYNQAFRKIEKQIFSETSVRPDVVTQEVVDRKKDELMHLVL